VLGESAVLESSGAVSDIKQARTALIARILEGAGSASNTQRRAAFNNAGVAEPFSRLNDKIANDASTISDEDIAAVQAAGLSEDQIFELAVCAAVGEANRQYEAALAALDAATKVS
jgi:hypothetical protein